MAKPGPSTPRVQPLFEQINAALAGSAPGDAPQPELANAVHEWTHYERRTHALEKAAGESMTDQPQELSLEMVRASLDACLQAVDKLIAEGPGPHADDGFDVLMEKLHAEGIHGIKPLLPEPRFGQDVALVAFLIDKLRNVSGGGRQDGQAIDAGTEHAMHQAWRKRAEEAEAALPAALEAFKAEMRDRVIPEIEKIMRERAEAAAAQRGLLFARSGGDAEATYRSGENEMPGVNTICPACVLRDPRLRLCVQHQGDAEARSSGDLQHELNAWREIGEEVGRVLSLMGAEVADDWFPDWFGPRLFDLQVKAQPAAARPSGAPPRQIEDETPQNALARRYMAEYMAMTEPYEDQEQNWILRHLVTFAAIVRAGAGQADAPAPVTRTGVQENSREA